MITITRAELLEIYKVISMLEGGFRTVSTTGIDAVLQDYELLDRVEKTLREKLTKEP